MAENARSKSELQRLRRIERLAHWAVEREQVLSVATGRSEVLRLFAEEIRLEMKGCPDVPVTNLT